ncbi:MAG TPA: hypothetical protein VFJ10_17160, partial [Acidobacteriaceae bacterium]|nr:hypothetical protein [Acidobacteriaceae bacterium]
MLSKTCGIAAATLLVGLAAGCAHKQQVAYTPPPPATPLPSRQPSPQPGAPVRPPEIAVKPTAAMTIDEAYVAA